MSDDTIDLGALQSEELKAAMHRLIEKMPAELLPVAVGVVESFNLDADLRYLFRALPFQQRHRWGGDENEFLAGVRAGRVKEQAKP